MVRHWKSITDLEGCADDSIRPVGTHGESASDTRNPPRNFSAKDLPSLEATRMSVALVRKL